MNILNQIFTDHRFWVFLFTNWAGVVLAALLVYLLFILFAEKEIAITQRLKISSTYIFFTSLIYQFLRHIEYAIQAYRYYFVEIVVDFHLFQSEWTRFFLTLAYFIGLVIVARGLIQAFEDTGVLMKPVNLTSLGILLVVPAWYMAEYVARIIRHIRTNCDLCPGILDDIQGWDIAAVNFWLGSLVLFLPLTVFLWYGFDWKLRELIKHFYFCFSKVKT